VKQEFVEHFQNLNPNATKIKAHGDFELEDV
jgi:hypothetical protein